MNMTADMTGNHSTNGDRLTNRDELRRQVADGVKQAPLIDVHTHLFARQFGSMNLSGIEELLTYHYLIAETFRAADITPESFWRMSKAEPDGAVWRALCVDD